VFLMLEDGTVQDARVAREEEIYQRPVSASTQSGGLVCLVTVSHWN
jgi:hypothetical protein